MEGTNDCLQNCIMRSHAGAPLEHRNQLVVLWDLCMRNTNAHSKLSPWRDYDMYLHAWAKAVTWGKP